MSKRVLIISSSPRRGGNSDTLCDRFMCGAQESGHTVEKILLREKTVNECMGCGLCYNFHKSCPQKDDAPEILEKMVQADVIVLATPVYFYNMSGRLKTLIDRCCARFLEMENKEFYFIATMGEDRRDLMERAFDGLRGLLLGCPNHTEKGVIAATKVLNKGDINKSQVVLNQAYEMGKNV